MHQASAARALKAREERVRTALAARLRDGAGWSDACILNVSSRGLLVYARSSVEPGTIVELRRGDRLVIAKVVWRENQRIGLCSQDNLSLASLASGELAAAAAPAIAAAGAERRKQPRDPERSRHRSRALGFVSLVLIGMILALGLGAYVLDTLAKPAAAVTRALAAR